MKKMRQAAAIAAVMGMTAGLLSGCGSGQAGKASTEQTQSTETAAGTETAGEAKAEYQIGICQLIQHDALDLATKGFQDALNALGEENGVSFVFDYQNAQGDSAVCATIANQFVADGKDLIMANATPALQACANATADIPIIATSITSFPQALDLNTEPNGPTGINVSGTNDLAPLSEQAQMIADIFPETKEVGILYCTAEVNSVYQAEHIKEYLDELGLQSTAYTFADSNELQSVVNSAAAASDVIYIPTDNTAAANTGIIHEVCAAAGVGIVAGEEGICEGCGVATFSVDFYAIGHRAGEMAYDILVNGADVKSMPVEDPDPATLNRLYNPVISQQLGIDFSENEAYTAMDVE